MRFTLSIKTINNKLIWNQNLYKGVYPDSENLNGKLVDFDMLLKELSSPKNSLITISIQELEANKSTPKGVYPKLKDDEECCYTNRQDCNYGEGYERCQFMKCKSTSNWYCEYIDSKKMVEIWITDYYPADDQFWIYEKNNDNVAVGCIKYYKLKNGKWRKKDVFRYKLKNKLYKEFISKKYLNEINGILL